MQDLHSESESKKEWMAVIKTSPCSQNISNSENDINANIALSEAKETEYKKNKDHWSFNPFLPLPPVDPTQISDNPSSHQIPSVCKSGKDPAVRIVGSRIYDPEHGKSCHQCRQKTMDFAVACKDILISKWNEAEKYICNPLSGEVPMECLSAKTLSGRSFRKLTSRFTMSAPLIYPSHSRIFHPNPTIGEDHQQLHYHFPIKDKKLGNVMLKTRDMGTQSTSQKLVSSISPTPTIHVLSSTEDQVRRSINVKGNFHQQAPNSTPSNIQKEINTSLDRYVRGIG